MICQLASGMMKEPISHCINPDEQSSVGLRLNTVRYCTECHGYRNGIIVRKPDGMECLHVVADAWRLAGPVDGLVMEPARLGSRPRPRRRREASEFPDLLNVLLREKHASACRFGVRHASSSAIHACEESAMAWSGLRGCRGGERRCRAREASEAN